MTTKLRTDTGKVTIATLLSLVGVFLLALVVGVGGGGHPQTVEATSTATTTVTVLNTPPLWTVDAEESPESSTSTPTNSGDAVTWVATGTDSNGEDYYLLICKSSSTPTGNPSAAPDCGGGGSDQWAVSIATASGAQASASYTTDETDVEVNEWFAYICDGNAGSPECNLSYRNGGDAATGTPFHVNHRPTFTVFADDSPTDPDDLTIWTTTADDPDSTGGDDTIKLFVCKENDFTGSDCGSGGTWATSSFVTSNPSATATMTAPLPDGTYTAYGFVIDEHGHATTTGAQGTDSTLEVANVAPTISTTSIALLDVGSSSEPLTLTVEEGETTHFVVQFTVEDDNSCETLVGGDEISDADVNVFRSGVGGTYGQGCDVSGEYNANSCYADGSPLFTPTCYQLGCAGTTTVQATWECHFPLWYIADPTDVGSPDAGENWLASLRATDDDAATGEWSTDDDGEELEQFLSYRATGSPIAYGAYQPGFDSGTIFATTTLFVTGNTGLDENLSGDAMCITYPTCNNQAVDTIFVGFQEYATSSDSIAYGSGFDLSTTTTQVEINIPATTATATPSEDDTYWGIAVPGSITLAGDYVGRNYIDGVVAESVDW